MIDTLEMIFGDFTKLSSEKAKYSEEYAIPEWKSLASRIQIGGLLPARVTVDPRSSLFMTTIDHYLTVTINVPERSHGGTVPIALSIPLPLREVAPTDKERMMMIRKILHHVYLHEADEQFKVLDAAVSSASEPKTPFSRPFDPHAPGTLKNAAKDFYPLASELMKRSPPTTVISILTTAERSPLLRSTANSSSRSTDS